MAHAHLHAGSLRLKTYSEYITLIAFPLQRWLHERVPVFSYTYIACIIVKFLYSDQIFHLSQYLTNLMHKICFTVSFISCLYMFRAHVLIIRRSKLHYTASGIITTIGVMIPEDV